LARTTRTALLLHAEVAQCGVALPVVGRGGEDAVAGQPFGDGEDAGSGEVLGVAALHDGCGERIGVQPVKPSAVDSLARIRAWAGVDESIAVGWSPAEEPTLGGGLGGHGAAHAHLDAVTFTLAHAAVESHDEVVGVAGP